VSDLMCFDARSDTEIEPVYSAPSGAMYCGDAQCLLSQRPITDFRGEVQLVFTSPPFPLNRKKRYGNLEGHEYRKWLSSFAPILRDYLTEDGSLVIELGNTWDHGQPTMSTLPIRTLLSFLEEGGLLLCQEFICFNPARLPTPAQWVTIERIRVKDAFTRVWWMSPVSRPKANNRSVLTQYSGSMKRLLKRGTYNPGQRPSEHLVGEASFLADNEGAIPPNVLVPALEDMLTEVCEVLPIANTGSNDPYQEYCRKHGIRPHPARMPSKLVEFFVRFLTDPDDLVLDPFAGSNTTGMVAAQLGRRWLSIEADSGYAAASAARFGQAT